MILIPFVFFTALTAYWWRQHKGFDLCVYMSAMYAFTSLCCAIVVYTGLLGEAGILFDETDLELNTVPTALFCGGIFMCMAPFSLFYKKDLKTITTNSPFTVDAISWLLIAVSLINLYLVADSTLDILQGDLEAVRTAHYDGLLTPAELKAETMFFALKYLYYLNISTLLCLPLFFYYVCFTKKPWWFCTLLFFASLSNPIAGIQSVDRTEIVFYAMMLISCIVIFHRFFSKKFKRLLTTVMVLFSSLAVVYLVAVSVARFDERQGAGEGMLQYAGQNYLNFCYFWENGKFNEISPERVFPLTSKTLWHLQNDNDRRSERSGREGFFMSVFPSFIGDIMLDITPIGMLVWILAYFLFGMIVIRMPHRKSLTIEEVLMIFVLSITPIFGIFYYRMMHSYYTYMAMIAVVAFIMSKIKFTIKNEDSDNHSDIQRNEMD